MQKNGIKNLLSAFAQIESDSTNFYSILKCKAVTSAKEIVLICGNANTKELYDGTLTAYIFVAGY